ncbi:unnamed protein product, partial [Dimorphilus gyrociliatus]
YIYFIYTIYIYMRQDMATGKYFINENELECCICLEIWVRKDPRVLPCQHTFCYGCLVKTVKRNRLTCPLCRVRTVLPDKGVKGLPNNLLKHSLKSTNHNEIAERCLKHGKDIIYPKLVCSTCKIKNLCEICIEDDHSNADCVVKSFKRLSTNLKDFWLSSKRRVDQLCLDVKNEIENLMETVKEIEESWHMMVDKKIKELKQKVKDYEEKKLHNLKLTLSKIGNIFINEDEIREEIDNLSKTKLMAKNSPKLFTNLDLVEKKIEEFKIFTKYLQIGSFENISKSFSYTNEGLYELSEKDNSTLITLRKDDTINSQEFSLDKHISSFNITKSNIYGLDKETGDLFLSRKPFKKDIILNKFNDNFKVSLFTAYDDDKDNEYIFCLDNLSNYPSTLYFYRNNSLKWKRNIRKRFYNLCILSNGCSLGVTGCEIYKFDKNNGNIIERQWLNVSPCISLSSLPFQGFLLADLQDRNIKQYDNNLNIISIFNVGIHPIYLKITSHGLLFVQDLDNPKLSYTYKIY